MKRRWILWAIVLAAPGTMAVLYACAIFATHSFGQQPAPTEQALIAKLNREIGENIGCSSALIQAQAHIAELEKQLATAKETKKE
jgi:hypothetical protein